MHKGYNSCEGASLLVGQVLDELPLGFFHIGHALWATTAMAIFAIHAELTPYMFPGLQLHFGARLSCDMHGSIRPVAARLQKRSPNTALARSGADKEELSTYAAAFQAGCAFGALVAPVLADKLGRKPTLVFGSIVTTLLNYGATFASSLNMFLGQAQLFRGRGQMVPGRFRAALPLLPSRLSSGFWSSEL